MDILSLLEYTGILGTIALIYYAWKKLSSRSIRIYFTIMILFFIFPMVLPFGETRTDTWMKHLLFYSGQFSLYMYLTHLIESYKPKTENEAAPQTPPIAAAAGIMSLHGTETWYNYLTDQGLEHFLTLPLLFLIMTVIRIQYHYIADRAFRGALNLCIVACCALVMIHVGEFVVESQHLMPFMEGEPIEITEFMWYFIALILFFISVKKLPRFPSQATV